MTLLEELKIFINTILHWIYYFVGFTVFFFVFGFESVTFLGREYIVPLPSTDSSIAVDIFNKMRMDLLPPDVKLIVTNPMSAFVSQIEIAILLGFLFTFPFFLYKFVTYLGPALLPHEKRALLWALLPFVILFATGAAFSYFFLIPATFKILYPYATSIGASTFFSLDEFSSYVFGLMVAAGLMFLLPLFMVILSFIKIIKPAFWMKIWRHALLFFLIFSAIITPDGTGITMIMLFVPLTALYFLGYYFAKRFSEPV